MKVNSNVISDKELIEFLGIEPEDLEFHKNSREIQVCAGTWKRADFDTWYFERDPEWDE